MSPLLSSTWNLLKINSRIKFSKIIKLWKINPIGKKLHHFEVTIESLRWGAVQDSSSKESWWWCGQSECVQAGLTIHRNQCKSLLVIWTWRKKRRRQCRALARHAIYVWKVILKHIRGNCFCSRPLVPDLYETLILPKPLSSSLPKLCTIYLINLSVGQLLTFFS
jgi:hypothetical protein